MKRNLIILTLSLILLVLTGCADTVNVQQCLPPVEPSGFWSGVWHGMIVWYSFVGSLFIDNITIYDVNNNGAWYNFGFIGGLGLIFKFIGFLIGKHNNKY